MTLKEKREIPDSMLASMSGEFYEKELKEHSKAIRLNPKDAEAYVERAIVKDWMQSQTRSRKNDINKAIEINPNLSDAYLYRGIIYRKTSNMKDYEKAIQLDANNAKAYNELADCYFRNGKDLNDALELSNKAIKLDPDNMDFYGRRASIKMALGYFEDALKDNNRENVIVERRHPDCWFNNDKFVARLERRIEISKASNITRRGPEIIKDVAIAFFNRGVKHYNNRKFDEAAADFGSASDVDYKCHKLISEYESMAYAMCNFIHDIMNPDSIW